MWMPGQHHWLQLRLLFWALPVLGLGFLGWTVYDRLGDLASLKEEIRARNARIAARDRSISHFKTQLAPFRATALEQFPGAGEDEAVRKLATDLHDLQRQYERTQSEIERIGVISEDRHLALEVINPRTAAAPAGSYVTTLYLIRNISDRPLAISGGPTFEWRTPRESGFSLPSAMHIKDHHLMPGRSWPFTAESWVGKFDHYPLSFSPYEGPGEAFETIERSQGLEQRVVFNFSVTSDGKTTDVSLPAPWIQLIK